MLRKTSGKEGRPANSVPVAFSMAPHCHPSRLPQAPPGLDPHSDASPPALPWDCGHFLSVPASPDSNRRAEISVGAWDHPGVGAGRRGWAEVWKAQSGPLSSRDRSWPSCRGPRPRAPNSVLRTVAGGIYAPLPAPAPRVATGNPP